MSVTFEFQMFAISVRPSPETNDHEVRLLGDGDELIDRFWEGMIGLDPDQLLLDPCPLIPSNGHKATIARCNCGEIGCGSAEVAVLADEERVLWVNGDRTVQFRAQQYIAEIARAQSDTTWETADRTAARLVRERVDRPLLARSGLTFDWASGRVASGRFTVSMRLEPGPYQLLVHVPWSGEAPNELADAMLAVLRRDPRNWENVGCFPQRGDLGDPPLSGPHWKLRGAG
jgi:hypothetical protein